MNLLILGITVGLATIAMANNLGSSNGLSSALGSDENEHPLYRKSVRRLSEPRRYRRSISDWWTSGSTNVGTVGSRKYYESPSARRGLTGRRGGITRRLAESEEDDSDSSDEDSIEVSRVGGSRRLVGREPSSSSQGFSWHRHPPIRLTGRRPVRSTRRLTGRRLVTRRLAERSEEEDSSEEDSSEEVSNNRVGRSRRLVGTRVHITRDADGMMYFTDIDSTRTSIRRGLTGRRRLTRRVAPPPSRKVDSDSDEVSDEDSSEEMKSTPRRLSPVRRNKTRRLGAGNRKSRRLVGRGSSNRKTLLRKI